MYRDQFGHWHISTEWVTQWTRGMQEDAAKLRDTTGGCFLR